MIKPVYALVGEDSFLQLEALAAIRAEFGEDVQRVDFDGERAALADVLDEVRSLAMFGGERKLVVMRNADDFISRYRAELEDYLEKPSPTGSLVLRVVSLPKTQRVYKLISKIGQVTEVQLPRDLKKWIAERARGAHKLNVEAEAVSMLAELVGSDLGRLDNELAKLALQVAANKVSVADIGRSVAFQREQELKDITIELATGRPDEALRRWRLLTQLDKSAEFRAVTWLTMWLEDVGQILAGESAGRMSWKYGPRLPQFLSTVTTMGSTRYRRAVSELAEVDQRSKSGLGEADTNIERFILSFSFAGG